MYMDNLWQILLLLFDCFFVFVFVYLQKAQSGDFRTLFYLLNNVE